MVKKDARPGRPCHIVGRSVGRSSDRPLVDVAEAGAGRGGDEQAEDLACGAEALRGESAGRRIRQLGRGIPRGEQKAVFRRFYRASNAGDRVGSGLGLATVREIVESRYGGKVSLSSTPGRGSTFTVTFPRSL